MSLALAENIGKQFLQIPGVWRGHEHAGQRALPTGHAELDRLCPGGGLPVGAVTELLCERYGMGEFGLLMPCIARLTNEGKRVALVAPPYLPYAQGLAEEGVRLRQLVLLNPERGGDALWAAEQTLRSGSVDLVVAWPTRVHDRDLRRLQLAAEAGESTAVLYRPQRSAGLSSPAALRIAVRPGLTALKLSILKSRGGPPRDLLLSPRFRQTGTGWA